MPTDQDKARALEAASKEYDRVYGEVLDFGEHEKPAFAAACEAYAAALRPEPSGETRLVRIAVAEDCDGKWRAYGKEGVGDEAAWGILRGLDAAVRLAIIEGRVPVGEVPVIAGDVKEVG